ncbi:MAG: metallopeptidase family protein [Nitriliruptor sp.]|uniref:metallopeptidase family protein n=1 Tax=Nitriliruptor sp. TaxID=2448056 RepID=UPI0034A0061F
MRDDRHARHRRADVDRRRRPVDGHRVHGRDRFERIVVDALGALPPPLLAHLDGVALAIEEVPGPDVDGAGQVPLARYARGAATAADAAHPAPARLTVFRRPLEARALSRADLTELIQLAVVHEVADHLGLDDDDLDGLGWP